MRPEFPFLAAGAVAIVGGTAREKRWPAEGTKAVLGTLVLVVVASATAGTRIAPVVRAIGLLLLLSSIIAAVPVMNTKRK
jgi:peptidoglycan/LPS O-acetylase OafA/YrhL